MFSLLVVALSLSTSIVASPLYARWAEPRDLIVRKESVSFNNWGGFQSLNGFDNFNGLDNFDGSNSEQIVVVQEEQVVCESVSIEIIQQQLAILREVAKKIISQQVCEVEVQTIVLEQFSSNFESFSHDLRRQSGRQVGFDKSISDLLSQVQNSDGSLNASNFGFSGSDVGNNTVVPQGSNWNDASSPASVDSAFAAASSAANSTTAANSTSVQ